MFGTGISLYYLEIGILGTFLLTFAEKSGTDLAGITPASVFFFYMDRIDPDIIPVKDTKTCGNDLAFFPDRGTDRFQPGG